MHKCQVKYKRQTDLLEKVSVRHSLRKDFSFPGRVQWGPLLNHSFNQQNKHYWQDIWLQGRITNANSCCVIAMVLPQSGIHFAVQKPPPLNKDTETWVEFRVRQTDGEKNFVRDLQSNCYPQQEKDDKTLQQLLQGRYSTQQRKYFIILYNLLYWHKISQSKELQTSLKELTPL